MCVCVRARASPLLCHRHLCFAFLLMQRSASEAHIDVVEFWKRMEAGSQEDL